MPPLQIYRSANGDRWLLACDPDTARVFVRHEPNLPSGGQVVDIEIGAFLIAAGNGPEKKELLRLIGRLVRGPADRPRSWMVLAGRPYSSRALEVMQRNFGKTVNADGNDRCPDT